jgi:hypothetical protein
MNELRRNPEPHSTGLASLQIMPTLSEVKDHSPRWARVAAIGATRGIGRATAGLRVVPDFLVIGAKRGGSTSMFNYLMMHPGVLGLFPRPRSQKSSDYFFREFRRGESWYRSNFHTRAYRERFADEFGYRPVSGEASPYYAWDPRIAARAYEINPELRAVMLVRNPVTRAFSHWQERVHNGVEPLTFAQALAAEPDRTAGELERMRADPLYYSEAHDWYAYRARGVYRPQLENWVSVFPSEQLLVVRSEDLYADVQATFDRVCGFLRIPTVALPTTKAFNAGAGAAIPNGCRSELAEYYAPINADLEQYLGRRLDW